MDVPTGIVRTIAGVTGSSGYSGDGGPALLARMNGPVGLSLDSNNNLYVTEWFGAVTRCLQLVPSCPATYSLLPARDLFGTSVGSVVGVLSEHACQSFCCDAPACDGYSLDMALLNNAGSATCFLFANITQLYPSNGYASGVRAGVL